MLLVDTLRFRPAVVNRGRSKRTKFNLQQLQNPETAHAYRLALTERLQSSNIHTWSDITTACTETATAVIGFVNRCPRPLISSEALEEIKHRKQLRNALLRAGSNVAKDVARSNYRASATLVKQLVRRDKCNYFDKLAEQAETAVNTGNLRGVYETIRLMSGNNIRPTATIKDENGAELTDPEHQLDRWDNFLVMEDQQHAGYSRSLQPRQYPNYFRED
ncbi:uncharacterized protein LOC119614755 [Lucilia sericata]|uniref:uncharacterized protein LOC119614755 n=1 Tax=Lucilia sericata TaxID=13632 RepID=UPI0018A8755A|nr:uncharacterized protein LOC119614755 [Lucilia sericata]